MKLEEFKNRVDEYGVTLSNYVETKTTKDINWTHKVTKQLTFQIPTGSKVTIWFSNKYPNSMFVLFQDTVKICSCTSAFKKFKGFRKPPTINTLTRWEFNGGYSKTPTGKKVEPDGFGPDGSPSWMIIIGGI